MRIATSAIEAVSSIQSGQRVFIHGGAATPHVLLNALYERREEFHNVELIHIHLEGDIPHTRKDFKNHFKAANLFVGSNIRSAFDGKSIDYIPIFLSQIPHLFTQELRPLDCCIINVCPPNNQGYCCLGTSVDACQAAVRSSPFVIAQINPLMPFVYGDGLVHVNDIDVGFYHESAPYVVDAPKPKAIDNCIANHIASLIDDGSTLQIGIGRIPNAALSALSSHKDLGIHTEVWTDSLIPLITSGVVNNRLKKCYSGKSVSTFLIGSEKLYSFIHNNKLIENLEVSTTNNPFIIGQNPKVVAINSAIEVDLTGQVCADSIGAKILSGVGGQVDFMYGAMLSPQGKSIIAMPSRTENGQPKITCSLHPFAGVVTTRAHVDIVVTENGIAHIKGKTLNERAKALIAISHEEDRPTLEKAWARRTL